MREFLILIKRELKSITKEKTIIFAILIQFFIASFSSIMLVGVMSFYDPASIGENTQVSIDVGVVGDFDSPAVECMWNRKNVQLFPYPDSITAERAFQSHHIDAVMFIPEINDGVVDMKLFLPESDIQSTLILMVLDEPLKTAENYLREANGIRLNYSDFEGRSHASYEFLYSIIIPLLMFFPALIAGSIVIDTISEELENKTLETLWAAPLSLNMILSSKICTATFIALLQCALWAGLLRLNSYMIHNLGMVIMLSVLIAAIASFGAGIIGLRFQDRERSQFIYSIVLLAAVGLSYLFQPSPFSLMTSLAMGNCTAALLEVALYFIPLGIGSAVFFVAGKGLVVARC